MSSSVIVVDASAALKALEGLSKDLATDIIDNIAERFAKGTFKEAFDNLSGSRDAKAATYPVPVRAGHLRRSLYMILPGGKKLGGEEGGREFKTLYDVAHGTAYVGNSAAYAEVTHEGRKDNKVEARPFLTDAAESFIGPNAIRIGEEELAKGLKKHGLD